MFLSKSNFITATNCAKALWLQKNRKDLAVEVDAATQQRFDIGNMVQDYARKYFPGGVLVDVDNIDVIKGAKVTSELAQSHDILFEATAKLDSGAFCRIDILKRNGSGWDLIEIKSGTSAKDEYITDLAFQNYVFSNAGYPVKQCFVLYLNTDYERKGQLDIQKLFTLENVTDRVAELLPGIPAYAAEYMEMQTSKQEPKVLFHSACKDCIYCGYCSKDVPEYSVFDLLNSKDADEFYANTGLMEVKDLPANYCKTEKQLIDRDAYLTGKIHTNPNAIKTWLSDLQYPLYYLDYETFQTPIPLFDGTHPYTQVPFQFSLHIQNEKGGPLQHISFLHKERTDPRRALAECLVNSCGDHGSVIVYNESFEKTRNKELALAFPDLANKILAINERIVDQLIPFRNRLLYNPSQHSSASIKKSLPAFSDLSYQGMEVSNGGEASGRYQMFMDGKLTDAEANILFDGLEQYCGQDTYAMVVLMDVLYKYAEV